MKSKNSKMLYKSLMGPIDLDDMRRRLSKEKPEQQSIRVKPSLFASFRNACEAAEMKQVDVIELLLIDFVKAVESRKKKKLK